MIPIIDGVPMNISALLNDVCGKLILLRSDIEMEHFDCGTIVNELEGIVKEALQILDLVQMR